MVLDLLFHFFSSVFVVPCVVLWLSCVVVLWFVHVVLIVAVFSSRLVSSRLVSIFCCALRLPCGCLVSSCACECGCGCDCGCLFVPSHLVSSRLISSRLLSSHLGSSPLLSSPLLSSPLLSSPDVTSRDVMGRARVAAVSYPCHLISCCGISCPVVSHTLKNSCGTYDKLQVFSSEYPMVGMYKLCFHDLSYS
jgi:hypothetical protein